MLALRPSLEALLWRTPSGGVRLTGRISDDGPDRRRLGTLGPLPGGTAITGWLLLTSTLWYPTLRDVKRTSFTLYQREEPHRHGAMTHIKD